MIIGEYRVLDDKSGKIRDLCKKKKYINTNYLTIAETKLIPRTLSGTIEGATE